MQKLELQALLGISQIDLTKDLKEILEEILIIVRGALGGHSGSIMLINEENDELEIVATSGLPDDYIERVYSRGVPIASSPSSEVLRTGRYYVVPDIFEEPREKPWVDLVRELGFSAQIGMPLKRKGEVIGLLNIYMAEPHEFTEDELAFLAIVASQAAAVIENARLYARISPKKLELEKEIAERRRMEETLRKSEETYRATLTFLSDITERKRAEDALRRSEEKYRTLIENIQDGVFILQGYPFPKLMFCNEAFAKMVGYTIEEIKELTIQQYVAPEDLERVANCYRRMQEGKVTQREYEYRALHKDGKTRVIVNMNVGRMEYQGEVSIIGTVKDITERKRAEDVLRESKELVDNILAASPIGIGVVENRKLSWANKRMMELFGFNLDEEYYIGQSAEVIYASKEEYGRVGQIFYENLKEGKIVEADAKLKRKDGSIFDGHIIMSFLDPSNPIKGAVATISDISWRKEAEEKLKNSEARLRIFLDFKILLPELQIPKVTAFLAKSAQGQPAGPEEFIVTRKDGKRVIAEVRTFPVKIKDETLVLCIARDITERVKVEKALLNKNKELEQEIQKRMQIENTLKLSERRYKEIAEFLPEQIYGSILILS
ncbi:MAG: PAS domain S-box protein [archaeon]|nr:PAS domain S-box protein [archaeon]